MDTALAQVRSAVAPGLRGAGLTLRYGRGAKPKRGGPGNKRGPGNGEPTTDVRADSPASDPASETASEMGGAVNEEGGRVDAVVDADLALTPGSVHALVGPNGSGKSTLLRALARLHPVADGDVLLGDESVLPLSAKEFARRVTLLGQSRPVPTGVSVSDVVGYGRHPYRGRFRGYDPDGPDAIAWALRVTGLTAMAQRGVDTLSGGERQRVWLATALAQRTDVLLLDEPTTYLDLRYQIEILDLIRDLADEHDVAVGVVLHDLNQAAAVTDRVTLLAEGRVVGSGEPAEVLTPSALRGAYGIDIDVRPDGETGRLTCHPIGRHNARVSQR